MLSVTNIARVHGPLCKHYTVTVNHEGVSRQFPVNEADIDSMIDSLGAAVAAQKALVILWLAYRRSMSRALTGVDIA